MNHLHRNLNRAFAADENNPSPRPPLHSGNVIAAEAYPAEHIDLKKPAPIFVGNLFEWLRLKDPEVVDQNVHSRKLLQQSLYLRRLGKIPSKAFEAGIWHSVL